MYNSHMASVHKQYLIHCPLCRGPFASKLALNQHLNICQRNAQQGIVQGCDEGEDSAAPNADSVNAHDNDT